MSRNERLPSWLARRGYFKRRGLLIRLPGRATVTEPAADRPSNVIPFRPAHESPRDRSRPAGGFCPV